MPRNPLTVHNVQLFRLVRGKLAQGNIIECNGPSEACRVAEERVRAGRAVGAAAFTRTVGDPEYDDDSEPVTLAIFGKVPPGLADQLPF